MNKIWLIAKREFVKLYRSKWFKFILILPLIGIGVLLLISRAEEKEMTEKLKKEEVIKIGIVDYTDKFEKYLSNDKRYKFIKTDSLNAFDGLMGGELEGFATIHERNNRFNTTYYSRKIAMELTVLETYLNRAFLKWKLSSRGLDVNLAEEIEEKLSISSQKLTREGEKGGGELIGAGFIMVISLYLFILMASQLMARSAVEEKLNGMIEILISDITPVRLLTGKFLGITGAIISLILIWTLVGVTFLDNAIYIINRTINFSIPPGIILYFSTAFVLGYILYTTFIMIFVSTVSTEQEINQAMGAGVSLIMIPYFLSFFWVFENPASMVSVVSSLFPFFTPLVMPLRLSISSVPEWEILLSILLLLIFSGITVILAGKAYRISMLMVGKPLKIREIFRILFRTEKK